MQGVQSFMYIGISENWRKCAISVHKNTIFNWLPLILSLQLNPSFVLIISCLGSTVQYIEYSTLQCDFYCPLLCIFWPLINIINFNILLTDITFLVILNFGPWEWYWYILALNSRSFFGRSMIVNGDSYVLSILTVKITNLVVCIVARI